MIITKGLTTTRIKYASIVAASLFALSSCTTLKSTFISKATAQQYEEPAPQFIDDFYPDATAISLTETTRSKSKVIADAHNVAIQRPLKDELYLEAEQSGANIGGMDYVPAGDDEAASEDLSYYEDLFLVNELLGDEKFDPTKMTDTIPVYLISPWSNCFQIPVMGKINSPYGWRHGRMHTGIDLDLETGDEVMAAFDGIVQKAEYYGGYGNLVVVKNYNGLETYYAHLSKIGVAVGDTLSAGDMLGLGGSTGHSTGPHLHFEIRYRGAPIDPRYVVNFDTHELKSDVCYLTKDCFKSTTTTAAKTASASKYYTVKKGDTLGKIAAKNKTTVSKICSLNKISSKKILRPGQKLRVK